MDKKAEVNGLSELVTNLWYAPKNFLEAMIRHGSPDQSSRAASQTVFSNLFLHIHSVRTHRWSLKPTFTFGLGVASLVSFIILAITGVVLMVHFKPTTALAYDSIKEIIFVIPGGLLIRNIHRWTGHLMVVLVLLHMFRVVLTGSYRQPREFNWLIGLGLLVLTFALAFTGYCLPWDQLGYWATVIGSNIAASFSEVTDSIGITRYFDPGGMQRLVLLGGRSIGDNALLRFYVLHCFVLPFVISIFIAVHFWRIRKDGGMSRPTDIKEEELASIPVDEVAETSFQPEKTHGLMCLVAGKSPAGQRSPEQTIQSWPHLFYGELAVAMIVLFFVLAVGIFVEAPLAEMANANIPENPAKAPWYFLGLQECVSYSAFSGGIAIPCLCLLLLAVLPFIDRGTEAGRLLGAPGEKKNFFRSCVFTSFATVGMLAFSVKFGWMRNWWPDINQIWIIAFNPGTVLILILFIYNLVVLLFTGSTRQMVVAFIACFITAFVIMTYFGTVHRGPNWDFYWWPSMWPRH